MDALCSVVLESRDINEKYQISELVRKVFQQFTIWLFNAQVAIDCYDYINVSC